MPHLTNAAGIAEEQRYAAIFIDFENIFYYLKQEYANLPDLSEYALILIRNLRTHLENELQLQPIVRFAYADFERLTQAPLGSLYLMGIEIRNVLGALHKNAADMRLCIDAMQVLYTRPDIRTFIFVAGDRDYIPVIQHIQTQARTVKTVAFRGNLSGDLLQNIGEENFIDAATLFSEAELKRLQAEAAYAVQAEQIREETRRRQQEQREQRESSVPVLRVQPSQGSPSNIAVPGHDASVKAPPSPTKAGSAASGSAASGSAASGSAASGSAVSGSAVSGAKTNGDGGSGIVIEGEFKPVEQLDSDEQREILALMLREYGSHPEIWLGPLHRRLTDAMPQLAEYQRRAVLNELEERGVIRIERRAGTPNDYRVILVNYNHPEVRELNPG